MPEHIDLKDLKILKTLLEEKHISRTAERLEMTQPAISKALAKLRKHFDDALLIRSPGGYQLSQNAVSLESRIGDFLSQYDQLFKPKEIVPHTLKAEFRLGMADDLAMLVLPRLYARLEKEAPGVDLSVTISGPAYLEDLRNGALDLLLEDLPSAGGGFYTQPLFNWSWSCLMSKTHPLADRNLTIKDYAASRHGLVSFVGDRFGVIDETLGRLDHSRSISVVLPYFSAIPHLVSSSNILFTVPRPLAEQMASHFDLVTKKPPIEILPLRIAAIWHHRNQHDSIQKWFRSFLIETLSSAEGL